MTTTKQPGDTNPNGLRDIHQPRPWHCTTGAATFCPVHGDCTCHRSTERCTMHGTGSDHPRPQPTMIR